MIDGNELLLFLEKVHDFVDLLFVRFAGVELKQWRYETVNTESRRVRMNFTKTVAGRLVGGDDVASRGTAPAWP